MFVAVLVVLLFPSVSRAGTWLPFGPKTYTRGTGAPVTVTDTFTLLNPATTYTLKVFNGGLQNDPTDLELVANSIVSLNGVQIVGPANFNQSVMELDVPITPGISNTLSVQVRGKPGGVLAIEIVGVDNDPPTITASVSPSPNAAGWNNSPVTVTFTCSDKTSGVASCPAPVAVSTEGANQIISGTATDLAGNTATASVTINLDMTPPTITGTINPPPDSGGYNSGPVTVNFTCGDALSGIASCSSPVSVTTEGTTPVPGAATDVAGNTATITITVNISFNYFKIRSWQVGPNGNTAKPNGMCLDYGTSPSGNGAAVFLNDCDKANPIRVLDIGPTPATARTGSGGTPLTHEVLLFAGNQVIGAHNPQAISLGGPPPPPTPGTEYQLELQYPWYSARGGALFSPAEQIWRLDGDSIILEGFHVELLPGAILPVPIVVPGPCISTDTSVCPAPPPQLVVQVQNALGANGSPLVASVRNLADNEFWDFIPAPGSRPYPTNGFVPATTPDALWNALCPSPLVKQGIYPPLISDPGQPDDGTPLYACSTPPTPSQAWGTVIQISSPFDCNGVPGPLPGQTQDIGGCIDLSGYPPLILPAGVTLRGNRRGTNLAAQLYFSFLEWHNLSFSALNPGRIGGCNEDTCMLEVHGDYVRVTGLHLRGETRTTDKSGVFKTIGIQVDYPGASANPPAPVFNLATMTEFIATLDHNDGSDWGESPVEGQVVFDYGIPDSSGNKNNHCDYPHFKDSSGIGWYVCDAFNQQVPYSGTNATTGVTIANDPGTLANILITRNFLHHNLRDAAGYGASVRGRALIEKNTFLWNHHHISADAEPHNEYRASHNLVMAGGYGLYSALDLFVGRQQDFDMHGTDNATTYVGGAAGSVEIDGNTFLSANTSLAGISISNGHDFVLRGYSVGNSSGINFTQYYGNVSLRNENDAVHFIPCTSIIGCIRDYHSSDQYDSNGLSSFPITISNSQFADSKPAYSDPTVQLGVGDFDGDGDDDLFMATGASWYYSPGGQREWRYLNSAPDTIDQLLLGDFDGDGRTDVVGMRNGKLFVSWGGISAFEPLNGGVPANCTMADMAVGDFDGDGIADIFCADYRNKTWWVLFGGNSNNTFVQVGSSSFPRQALGFGDFNHDGTTDVFGVTSYNGTNYWQVSYSPKGMRGTPFSGWTPLQPTLTNPTTGNPVAGANEVVIADFNGDGTADVGIWCGNGGILGTGIGAYGGWQISLGGTQGWSSCTHFSSSLTLANGAVGRFSGGPGADILLWNFYNKQSNENFAANLWDLPGGTGTPYQISAQDVDMH